MNSLNLELVKPVRNAIFQLTWLGVLLLMLGCGVLGYTWLSYADLQSQQASINEQLSELKLIANKNEKSKTKEKPVETNTNQLEAIQVTIKELVTPWDELFNSLEAAMTDDVVLLGLRPDRKKNIAIITGEAKNYFSILNYIEQLATQPNFSEVYLQKHIVNESDQNKPVNFTISVRWLSLNKELAI
jgi:hypothetical protein